MHRQTQGEEGEAEAYMRMSMRSKCTTVTTWPPLIATECIVSQDDPMAGGAQAGSSNDPPAMGNASRASTGGSSRRQSQYRRRCGRQRDEERSFNSERRTPNEHAEDMRQATRVRAR